MGCRTWGKDSGGGRWLLVAGRQSLVDSSLAVHEQSLAKAGMLRLLVEGRAPRLSSIPFQLCLIGLFLSRWRRSDEERLDSSANSAPCCANIPGSKCIR